MDRAVRDALMLDIYGVIAASGAGLTLFAAVIDKLAFHLKTNGSVEPYEGAFQGLCSMFDLFLRRKQKFKIQNERGIVVFDESQPALAKQMRTLLARFQSSGTKWVNVDKVIETPFFFDSKASRLMQIADFASYAVFRWYESGDDGYLKLISDKFDTQHGKVHGLKCYPLVSTKIFPEGTAVPNTSN